MKRKILEVEGLSKNFGGLQASGNLSFVLFEGDQDAIIGPNGAGKTTFFNLLTGYHRPDSGRVLFDGNDITGKHPHEIARIGISRAFQVSNIFSKMTVYENVRSAVQAQIGMAFDIFRSASRLGNVETGEVLSLCGLTEKSKVMAGSLSQGDKKKLELALALAGKPRLLLLDEPTAGMSLEETRETMALVDHLNQTQNITILFTEHDLSVVFNHARRITLLHHGQILVTGTPDQIRKNESAQKIYFGEQY
ncbi:MAG: ABC transporter ATP-binding protein [Syntrophobacteraceae bacterium]